MDVTFHPDSTVRTCGWRETATLTNGSRAEFSFRTSAKYSRGTSSFDIASEIKRRVFKRKSLKVGSPEKLNLSATGLRKYPMSSWTSERLRPAGDNVPIRMSS